MCAIPRECTPIEPNRSCNYSLKIATRMKRNRVQLEQGSSGFPFVLANENGNRHSNCSTSRRKMRIVSRKCCAHKEAVAVPLSSPALPTTTLIEENSEPIKSAINDRNTGDNLSSPPTIPGVSEPEELLVGQADINDDTQTGTGCGQLSNGFRSRYLITRSLSLSDNSECDSSLYSRRSSSSCSSHSSFMSHSPSDSYEEKKRKTFVSLVVGGRLADQAIKREDSCGESNESDADWVCIDYTRTSRYPEKKKKDFSYPEYERSLLLEAASKMLNADDQQQQQLFKVEEDNTEVQQKLYYEASNSGSSCSSNPFSTSHSFIPKEKDDEDRKLFIGGLSFDTSECDLEKYFSRFGIVDGINLKYDSETGISRGFAFISFAEEESTEEVLKQPVHIIHGRWIEPRRAKSRPVYKKIFVGGIDGSLTLDDIRDYFSRFGKVAQVDIPFDRLSQERRHFCFVVFTTEEAAEEASMWPRQMVKGRLLDVRRTVPRNVLAQQKRVAQAAGLDLNEYDCNYKLGKMNATARMVTASAAMAAAALATPIAHFVSPAAGPQMSVTPTGALIPLADHISHASMAALGVANQPHAYPAAATFSTNLYASQNANSMPTYATLPHSYNAFPYMNTFVPYHTPMYHQNSFPIQMSPQQSFHVSPYHTGSNEHMAYFGYSGAFPDYSNYYSQQYCHSNVQSNVQQQLQPPPPPLPSMETSAEEHFAPK